MEVIKLEEGMFKLGAFRPERGDDIFNLNLRVARVERGLSLKEVAKYAGRSITLIDYFERLFHWRLLKSL